MLHRPSPFHRLISVAALLAVAGAGDSALAQVVDVMKAARPVIARKNNEIHLDSFIFGNLGVGSAEATRSQFESQLTLHVEELARIVELGPPQKKKLLLAGRGDMKRYFDRIEEVRQKYLSDPNFQFNARVQQIWQDLQPLQTSYNSGLFGEGSLFAKTKHATLTPDQARKAEELERERMLYHYWNRIDLGLELVNLDVGFTEDQRARLIKLLRAETRPPRKMARRYDFYVVFYQLGRIPEEKIRPIFEDYQWPIMARELQQGRALERLLRQQGFEPDEPEAPRPPEAKPATNRQEARK